MDTITLSQIKEMSADEKEICKVVDKKVRNGVLYLRVQGDQGTDLTYKHATFLNAIDDGKINYVDDSETEFTIERTQELDLW